MWSARLNFRKDLSLFPIGGPVVSHEGVLGCELFAGKRASGRHQGALDIFVASEMVALTYRMGGGRILEARGEQVDIGFVGRIVATATIGGFMFGYDSGVINGTQKGLEATFALGKLGVGINVGAILMGSAIGAFVAGRLADAIGRRRVMMLAALVFLVSALITGAAGSSEVFILGRILGGLGVGAASVISPVYISEVAPAAIRGRLASMQQIMIITGLTGSFVANFALARLAGSSLTPLWGGFAAWRWMFWMQVFPAGFYLVALLAIPESPRFLIMKRRQAEALAVLNRLFGPIAAASKATEIDASLAADHHRPRLSDLVEPGTLRLRPIVWVGLGLAVFQQLVGINVVFYYGATLWEAVGFSEDQALQTNILSGAVSIAACLVTMGLIDRIGRKPLLLIGSVAMAGSLATMAWAFSLASIDAAGAVSLPGDGGVIALVAANLYVFFFNLSWGPVMWVMLGEMFPNQIRGSGLAVAGFAQWIANAAVSVTFPALAISPGLALTYVAYAFFALLSALFVNAMVRETRGVELEAMHA